MARRNGVRAAVFLLVAAGAAGASGEPGKISKEKISFKGRERVFFLLVPPGIAPERKIPLLLTLHGSGQNAGDYVSAWKDLAEKEKIVVAGPASRSGRRAMSSSLGVSPLNTSRCPARRTTTSAA